MKSPYLVGLRARFKLDARPEVEPGRPAIGYRQTIGLTSHFANINDLIREFIASDTGAELAAVEWMRPPHFKGEDRSIVEFCGRWTRIGVWYRGERVLFS
jgi:hypothetical protein